MKKVLMIAVVLAIAFSASSVAYADDMTPRSVDVVLAEIQQEQGVNATDQIDPDKVSQAKLEELGDSVMEAMIGNSQIHDQMDNRLGGDGSASLTAFHTRLGYNYLVGYPNGMMSLMVSGMMGNYTGEKYNWTGMMGNNGSGNYGGMMGSLGWGGLLLGLLILALLAVVLFAVLKSVGKKSSRPVDETPLELLKRRYAAGEVPQEEYERILEHLKN